MIKYSIDILKNSAFNKYYWQSIFTILNRHYKVEYGVSYLGNIWMVIKPFILIAVYAVVFSRISRFPAVSNYPFFLTTNITLWILIAGIITMAPSAIVGNANILKLCPIPKTTFIIVEIFKQVRIYFISLIIIFVVIGFFFEAKFHLTMIFFPLYFAIFFLIIAGMATCLAYLFPYIRDIKTLIDAAMPALMFLTPVIYPQGSITGLLGAILKYSPFSILMTPFTKIIFNGEMPNNFDHIALFSLLIIVSILTTVIHKKLSRNVIYYM